MTETELELYKNEKLQKLFVEKMGPWRHGDPCWSKNNGVDFYCQDCLENNIFSPNLYLNTLRLPLPIGPMNPERGLWGMIQASLGKDVSFSLSYNDEEIEHRKNHRFTLRVFRDQTDDNLDPFTDYNGATPTEALLRALIAQIGG